VSRSHVTYLPFQGASSPEPSSVFVDLRALRNDRVSLVERGSPHSLCLLESGKLLPGVKVIIANPETKGQCGDSHLGEVNDTFTELYSDLTSVLLSRVERASIYAHRRIFSKIQGLIT